MKLPDELVERAAKLTRADFITRTGTQRLMTLADLVEVALSEGGTTQRFCLYHGATAVSDPEVSWCRIADRSNPKAADWCKVVDALVIPLDSKE